ncbi:MAG TPA: DUF167 family protein [Gemmatimonadales bacterium]
MRVRVQPRASRSEVVGLHGDEIRLRVNAPPVDGAANEAVVRLLAERLGVPRSAVEVAAGAAARHKVVLVAGVTRGEAAQRLGLGPADAGP